MVQFPKKERVLLSISKDLVNYLESEHVIYAEVRFAPMFHTRNGLSLSDVVESVIEGVTSSKVKVNLILCMMRGMDKKLNLETIEVARKYLGKCVCALDLAGDECKYPLEMYLDLFQIINEYGIPYTIHAGEDGPSSAVLKAIEIGAKRIGHGIHSIDNLDVLKLLKNKGVLLEVCPTSNVQTNAVNSYSDHPIKKFYDKGISVNISTYNITVSNITISEEYSKLMSTFGFDINDFEKMNLDSINHAFVSDEVKKELVSLYEEKIQKLKMIK